MDRVTPTNIRDIAAYLSDVRKVTVDRT